MVPRGEYKGGTTQLPRIPQPYAPGKQGLADIYIYIYIYIYTHMHTHTHTPGPRIGAALRKTTMGLPDL